MSAGIAVEAPGIAMHPLHCAPCGLHFQPILSVPTSSATFEIFSSFKN